MPERQPFRIESAVVFGGNSEIALATLVALVPHGLQRVVLAVRDPAHSPAAAALRDRGLRVHLVHFDADETDAHPAAVARAFATLGTVDVALVAFGVLGDREGTVHDRAAAVALARTNFVGAVSVLTVLGERMRAQGRGTIVVLSSVAGLRARRANYPYGATKAGLDAFAQGLGDALAPAPVHVMVVRPGFVRGRMTAGRPVAPMAVDPPAVAGAIVAGLRRRAHVVWAPPVLVVVWAVLRLLPRGLWRRVRG